MEGEDRKMYGVTIEELIQKMNLVNKTPELDTEKIVVAHPDVNRPALQLTGFSSISTGSGCRSSGMWSPPT